MIKVMIAEDEYLERKAIKFFLEKYYSNQIEVVAEVTNGEDVLSETFSRDIDIILLDIKMPRLDGLKAAELIKDEIEDLEIIILTAHSEFEYAQKSIHIGVNDYLVKPYLEEEFRDVMDKTISEIIYKNKQKENQSMMKHRLNELTPILEKEIILEIIYGTNSSLEKFDEYRKLLDYRSNNFMFLIIKGNEGCVFSELFLNRLKSKINMVIDEVVASIALQDMVFLLLDDNINSIRESRQFKDLLFDVKNELRREYKNEVEMAYSHIYNNLKDLYNGYNETKSILIKEDELIVQQPYQEEKVICGKIIDRDLDGALHEFNIMFNLILNSFEKETSRIKNYLKEFVILLNGRISDFFNGEIEVWNLRLIESEIDGFKDIYNIKLYMQNLIKELVVRIIEHNKDKKNQVIETVKDYIKGNYNQEISLSEMAEYISFSQYYLSKLFKEVEGINFKDYIIQIRMEEAKKLLKKGNKIKEVAGAVGYSDPNYFSRAFKKYTGISPSKYL